MKFKTLFLSLMLGMSLSVVGLPVVESAFGTVDNTAVVYAIDDYETDDGSSNSSTSSYDNGVSDFFKGFSPVNSSQINEANTFLTPLLSLVGYLIGGIIAVTSTAIFLITALDLLYIGFPPVRNLLFVDGQSGGMGYGQNKTPGAEKRQWVSDEAVQCATLLGNNQTQSSSSGGMMGMGMGMQQSAPASQMPVKSVILTYFKKRSVFLVLFVICSTVLLSSAFIGTGMNLAQWFMKIIETVNGYIPV